MIKEKSCGAIIYKIEGQKILFLISHMGYGHNSFTKGHVEENETEIETAQREIYEETGLKPIIDCNFRYVITYSPKQGVIKDVVFFVAKSTENKDPKDWHDDEVVGFSWCDFDESFKAITFNSDRETLIKAYEFIRGRENGKF